jgi:hypothetical protein
VAAPFLLNGILKRDGGRRRRNAKLEIALHHHHHIINMHINRQLGMDEFSCHHHSLKKKYKFNHILFWPLSMACNNNNNKECKVVN